MVILYEAAGPAVLAVNVLIGFTEQFSLPVHDPAG
jgi:hypothetical protein